MVGYRTRADDDTETTIACNIRTIAAGEFDEGEFVREVFPKLEPERNHACHLCA